MRPRVRSHRDRLHPPSVGRVIGHLSEDHRRMHRAVRAGIEEWLR